MYVYEVSRYRVHQKQIRHGRIKRYHWRKVLRTTKGEAMSRDHLRCTRVQQNTECPQSAAGINRTPFEGTPSAAVFIL